MDEVGNPIGSLPPIGDDKKGPGRPALSTSQRALADEKYAQRAEMLDLLPEVAREARWAIYLAKRRVDEKAEFTPVGRVLASQIRDSNLKEEGTFKAYLISKYGEDRYYIEPQDPHNKRIEQMASWCVNAYENEEDMNDDNDDDYEPRSRRRSSRFADDGDDDDREQRANVSDILTTIGRTNSAQAAMATRSSSDMMQMMLMTQQIAAQARADEDRRKDERLATERKEAMDREERKRLDDKADMVKREEDRRREWDEERRREDREREERRRDEDKKDQQRREEYLVRQQAENKKFEVIMGIAAAAMPVLQKIMEKKEDPLLATLIAKSGERKEADPMTIMLLKSMIDKGDRSDSTQVIFQQMGEMAKLQSSMSAEQMRSMMAMSNDINKVLMQKAIDMMMASPQGQTAEGKSTIEQIMGALQGASEIVKALVPPAPVGQPPQQQQRRLARAPAPQPPVHTQPGPQGSAPEEQPQQQHPQQIEAPQPQPEPPTGVAAVMHGLRVIQTNTHSNIAEYQQIVAFMLSHIPLNLRVAVLYDDQMAVLAITNPVVSADADLSAWVSQPGVLAWITEFVPTLKPSIEQSYGPAADQRAQLDAILAGGAQGLAVASASPEALQATQTEQAIQVAQPVADSTTALPVSHLDPDAP